jgi:ABC-type multidrug transport system ATPase subunit
VLTFSDLARRFGRHVVLTGQSGTVAPGQLLTVLGRNGSGKSTLLRILAGLLVADRGTVEYHEGGRPLSLGERRRAVGYVAPDLSFYEDLSALENLQFFARLRGLPSTAAAEWLARVDLPPERAAGALSSGMRQRLRFAFALLARPRLVLLDEPVQNLDAGGATLVRALLAEHLAGGGLAVVANPEPLDLGRPAESGDHVLTL